MAYTVIRTDLMSGTNQPADLVSLRFYDGEDKQAALAKNNVAEQDVVLGVRPEHIELGSGIEGRVDVHEMMGSSVHLHIQTCGRDSIIIVPTLELKTNDVFNAGHEIRFTFNNQVIHVFDPETGNNLEYM